MDLHLFKKKIKIFFLDLFDLVSFLVFVVGVVLFIRFFIFNPYTVVWKSMTPTFEERDFIIVDKITPKIWTMERWDIVVFVPDNKDIPFIKRVIGLPWETVKINDWNVYICDNEEQELIECNALREYYMEDDTYTSTSACNRSIFPVEEGWYFVLWDNRDHSTDSRCCFWLQCTEDNSYLIYDRNLIWKVAIRIYPNLEPYR